MQRELFVVQSLTRLSQVLQSSEVGAGDVLGVGVFSAVPAGDSAPGIAIRISPKSLRSQLLCTVGSGFLAPVSGEIVFLGDSRVNFFGEGQVAACAPVSRWLLLGLHSAGFSHPDLWASYLRLFPDLASAHTPAEILGVFFRAVHSRVLDLRPDKVLFLFDLDLMVGFVEAIFRFKGREGVSSDALRSELLDAVLSWSVEELLHPCALLCYENVSDFHTACSSLRLLRQAMGDNCDLSLRM